MRKRTQQAGFGLVEMMLSLLLSGILIALITQHYLSLQQQSKQTNQTISIHYHQTQISELLRTSIQQAGFSPCLSIPWLAGEDEARHALPAPIEINNDKNHALQISRMSEDFSIVKQLLTSQTLLVEPDVTFRNDEKILIADCFHAEVKTIQKAQHQRGVWHITLTTPLHAHYQSPIYLGEWLLERYYIAQNSHGETVLYYQTNRPEAISNNIQSMSVHLVKHNTITLVLIDFLLPQNQHWQLNTATRQ
jgi:type II secretory pathway pseudopilin PulG